MSQHEDISLLYSQQGMLRQAAAAGEAGATAEDLGGTQAQRDRMIDRGFLRRVGERYYLAPLVREALRAMETADSREIRLDDDGCLDEVVGRGPYQLECMGDHWDLHLGEIHLWVERLGEVELPMGVQLPGQQTADEVSGLRARVAELEARLQTRTECTLAAQKQCRKYEEAREAAAALRAAEDQLRDARTDRDEAVDVLQSSAPFCWTAGTRMEADARKWADRAIVVVKRLQCKRSEEQEGPDNGERDHQACFRTEGLCRSESCDGDGWFRCRECIDYRKPATLAAAGVEVPDA
jgi:hypothetical protein